MRLQTVLHSSACILTVLFLFSPKTQAQSGARLSTALGAGANSGGSSKPAAIDSGTNEFGVWGGSSSDFPTLISGSRDARLPFILGLRYGRTLATIKSVAFEYTIDAVPVAVVSQPRVVLQPSGPPLRVGNERDRIYGGGVIPVGFRFIFRREARVKPFVGARSGPFYFTSRVPRPDAARFNFLSTGAVGFMVATRSRQALTIGYEFGHLSNAGVSRVNPGFNMNYLVFGYSVFK